MVSITTNITAVGAVGVLANCTVNLYVDNGEIVRGEWQPALELIAEDVTACRQKAKASQIARFERGGERLEGASVIYLTMTPSQRPTHVETGGLEYRVVDVDDRPSRIYYKMIVARKTDES
ncbi:TPA: hypothetical protein VGT17_005213 [Vibrio harveyi]|nr:hypothetical protein [Vibrio harveyi]HEQ3599245.1 hypothetical protein [Vibrio harveyi]HEQ3611303.1 hypothetical protein [Vibrio harveyi]